jgi:hypothetical protein
MSAADTPPAFAPRDERPGPHGTGARFRRPLTDAELAVITAAGRRGGRDGGLDGAFRATWDILLREAESVTMEEADRQGLKFHPGDYAIPLSQSVVLLSIWRRHRGPRYRSGSAAGMLWIHMGPGSYPDDAPPTPASGPAR